MLIKSGLQVKHFLWLTSLLLIFQLETTNGQPYSYVPESKVEKDFKALLARPATTPRPYSITTVTDSIVIEKGYFYSEETEKVPFLINKPVSSKLKKLPVIIVLHGTGGSKDDRDIRALLYHFSKLGFMSIAIDARFHGERAGTNNKNNRRYNDAIIEAWENRDPKKQAHPFFFDTVYDLWKLTDYLITRKDVEPSRIGMTGISMGGIETWMAASVDKRIKVSVPVIAAQSFKWSLENNRWQGRAGTIRAAHEKVAADLGDKTINSENVKALWNKILPGILDEFDCPSMIRLFSPRPLLLLSNAEDQNCPLPGAEIVFKSAQEAYQLKNASAKLKINVTPNEPHRFLPEHEKLASEWFTKWL
ncbi:alpha/beta hydrolase family protein [Dyadobacter subterraneus]|uniref:Acetylxylan esterase n=1 Tax=Dyadobacter subterraneus TaxID=2773304 RepID=A0ABR9WFN8_9BACT|nr:acetylxylan esterase [Dyadobacter subterraneus]MBE9464308.1 acetylxylan esterase [Dyadobacter subterraneus]